MTEQADSTFERREFLYRSVKAGVSIAAAGLVSAALYDSDGPGSGLSSESLVRFRDWAIPPESGRTMSIVSGSDRRATVKKAIELLGGIRRFVKPGQTVAIKPNVAFASPAMLGATANPELVAQVVKLCRDAGAKRVIATDNPINEAASCFMLTGIGRAAELAGAKVVLPRQSHFRHTSLEGGRLIRSWPVYFEPFARADALIGIAPVKHHQRSGASMTMKNWYGLLGGPRNVFHQDINTIIAELSMMVKPSLVILDGTEVMMTNGPTGGSRADLRRADTMIASCDMVAADSFGSTLLGLKPADLPYLAAAARAGVGTTDYQSLKPASAVLS